MVWIFSNAVVLKIWRMIIWALFQQFRDLGVGAFYSIFLLFWRASNCCECGGFVMFAKIKCKRQCNVLHNCECLKYKNMVLETSWISKIHRSWTVLKKIPMLDSFYCDQFYLNRLIWEITLLCGWCWFFKVQITNDTFVIVSKPKITVSH